MLQNMTTGKIRVWIIALALCGIYVNNAQARHSVVVEPLWLPDDDSLLLLTDSTVWHLALDTSDYVLSPLPLQNQTYAALMTVSAEGTLLAYYAHPEIRLFSLETGEIVERFILPKPGFPAKITLSPDAQAVAVNYVGVMMAVFRRGNAEPIALIDGADYATINDQWDLIVSGPGNRLRFWKLDVNAPSPVTPLAYHAPAVGYVYRMDMDEDNLAYGDRDGTLYLVDTANGIPRWTRPLYDGFCGERGFNVIFAPDGESLAATCFLGDQFALIETVSGEIIASADEPDIHNIVWLKDGLLAISNQQATLFTLPDLETSAIFEGRYASVNSAGTRLVLAADSAVQIWDLQTFELLYEIPYEGL